jgi:predicted RNA binding protein YcfA (HicA-like mRNA interferase family)
MSSIDYSKLRGLTARKLINALQRDGFIFSRQSGSHQIYYHPDGRRVTVTFHKPSDTFPIKTLKRILEEEAGWTEEDLRRLKLLKK